MRPPLFSAFASSSTSTRIPRLVKLPAWRWYACRYASSLLSAASSELRHRPTDVNPPFRFVTGIGLFAKRSPRPFPPPFLSPPSASFSDPLSTHHQSRNRAAFANGELIKGLTNGDDAVYASNSFICVNDGVGAWATRPRGHAGLWSRLVLHFWATAIEASVARAARSADYHEQNPTCALEVAYEQTLDATKPHDWQGTTTACGAQLHYAASDHPSTASFIPLLCATNLGDCQVMVVRPRESKVVFKTKEHWHWFDCPRRLGTNSPDKPKNDAVMDTVRLEVGDIVLAMSDGVIDNLWEHEIIDSVVRSVSAGKTHCGPQGSESHPESHHVLMERTAQELVAAARDIALEPYAESPFMEHAIEEGLASAGGKLDDISVVAAICMPNEQTQDLAIAGEDL